MRVKCVKSEIPFYKDGKEYEISRTYVGNIGETKGIHYTVIRVENGYSKHVKTTDLDTNNCDFVRIQ